MPTLGPIMGWCREPKTVIKHFSVLIHRFVIIELADEFCLRLIYQVLLSDMLKDDCILRRKPGIVSWGSWDSKARECRYAEKGSPNSVGGKVSAYMGLYHPLLISISKAGLVKVL